MLRLKLLTGNGVSCCIEHEPSLGRLSQSPGLMLTFAYPCDGTGRDNYMFAPQRHGR